VLPLPVHGHAGPDARRVPRRRAEAGRLLRAVRYRARQLHGGEGETATERERPASLLPHSERTTIRCLTGLKATYRATDARSRFAGMWAIGMVRSPPSHQVKAKADAACAAGGMASGDRGLGLTSKQLEENDCERSAQLAESCDNMDDLMNHAAEGVSGMLGAMARCEPLRQKHREACHIGDEMNRGFGERQVSRLVHGTRGAGCIRCTRATSNTCTAMSPSHPGLSRLVHIRQPFSSHDGPRETWTPRGLFESM